MVAPSSGGSRLPWQRTPTTNPFLTNSKKSGDQNVLQTHINTVQARTFPTVHAATPRAMQNGILCGAKIELSSLIISSSGGSRLPWQRTPTTNPFLTNSKKSDDQNVLQTHINTVQARTFPTVHAATPRAMQNGILCGAKIELSSLII